MLFEYPKTKLFEIQLFDVQFKILNPTDIQIEVLIQVKLSLIHGFPLMKY